MTGRGGQVTGWGWGSETHPRVPHIFPWGTSPPSLGRTHLNHQQHGGRPARLAAPRQGVGGVEEGGWGPPAPPEVVEVGMALGHLGAEGLGGGRYPWAGGVQGGAAGGWAQPPAAVGVVEEGGAGGRWVLVGEMGLGPEPEHLQQKEDVGEMVAQQGTVPPTPSLCHRGTLCPWAHPHAPASVSLPNPSSVPGVPTRKRTS